MYFSRLAEAFRRMGIGENWQTLSAFCSAKGVDNAQDWSLNFDNYMTL